MLLIKQMFWMLRLFTCFGLVAGLSLASPKPAPAQTSYTFSILEGDVNAAYPLTQTGDRFTVHYQRDSFAAKEIKSLVTFIAEARAHINRMLGVNYAQPFDIYLANTLFAPPDQALRGRAFSARRTLFVLYDGSGTPAERHYMLTHELTHLIAWNTYGKPASALLSEGVAVYAAEKFLVQEPFLPIQQFCLAYRQAGRLPLMSSRFLVFEGHLYSLNVYFTSGCFVKFLAESYGVGKLSQLYSSLKYPALYQKTLKELEQLFMKQLDASGASLPPKAAGLPDRYERVLRDYRTFFASVSAGNVDEAAYRALDARRVNLLKGE